MCEEMAAVSEQSIRPHRRTHGEMKEIIRKKDEFITQQDKLIRLLVRILRAGDNMSRCAFHFEIAGIARGS